MELPAEMSPATDVRRAPVRRRLVQSTLFPHSKRGREDDNCKVHEVEEEEKQCCNGNKAKKNSKRKSSKPKTTPRASKQTAVNGKEMSIEMEDGGFPAVEELDVIAKKKLEEEHICSSQECISPNSPISTRSQRRLKKRAKSETLPKENGIANQPKVALFKRTPPEFVLDEPNLPLIPDLRSESKLTAEENSRLFAGKPLHPFFSSFKASKRNQEIIELENSQHCLESKEGVLPLNPIHVLEGAEEDAISLDWGQWEFSEGMCPSTSSGLGSNCSSFFERFVSSLKIDDYASSHCPSSTSTCQNKDKRVDDIDAAQTFSSSVSSVPECQLKFLPNGSLNQIENSLWTDKYQPSCASQICGNGESVKFISEWLSYWHKKSYQKNSLEGEKSAIQDNDSSYDQGETDSECWDDETSLKNVLLVTGPVGSGKSAAIYACAQEQGFQVIEVNASDWRNGALVKQRFKEALESHRHHNKSDNAAIPKRSPAKSLFGVTTAAKGFEGEVEVVTVSDEENSQACGTLKKCSEKENGVLTDQSGIKTLILFEDVDATLSEDHGFLSTIQQLALTAKRPMILTSNENGYVLPKNLERLEVHFEIPLTKELLGLGHVVCNAEKANIHPRLIDRCVEHFQGDIRKTILHLQFWCQGQSLRTGASSEITYSPLPFDLDAGHHVLPKLIPLGSPSHLSEHVQEAIANSLISVQECQSALEVVSEQDLNCKIKNGPMTGNDESDRLQAKKKAMLSLNSFFGVEDESLAQPGCTAEFPDTSGSPVTFAKRKVRRKLCAVVSSDSEEEGQYEVPLSLNLSPGDTNDNILGVSTSFRPPFSSETLCGLSTEQCCHNEGYQEEQKSVECSKTSIHPSVHEVCNSADVSSVPESVFIPETEISSEARLFSATVSYEPLCFTGADSLNGIPNLSVFMGEQVCEPLHRNQEMLGTSYDIGDTILLGELLGNSHIVHEDNYARPYQMLDECSRCDFAVVGNSSKKPGFAFDCNAVEETWKRLRECHGDLQQLVTPEYKDSLQAMKLSFGMSNLISETDLLHGHNQPDNDDPLESSRWPGEVVYSYGWYDDHLEMSSAVAQHGICFYAKEAAALVSSVGSCSRVNLALEMLSSSTNSMALGKLLSQDKGMTDGTDRSLLKPNIDRRKMQSSRRSLCRSVVSPRAYLALEGDAFHECFSALSQISRIEAGRVSLNVAEKKQRRCRARHYLSSGTYMLPPEEISMLSKLSSFQKAACQYQDPSIG